MTLNRPFFFLKKKRVITMTKRKRNACQEEKK